MADLVFNICFGFYFAAVVFYFVSLLFARNKAGAVSDLFLFAAFAVHTFLVVFRFWQTGQPPFVTLFESLLFYSWSILFAYLLFRNRYKLAPLSGLIGLVTVFIFGALSFLDKTSQPLIPALKSNWLFIHVSSYFIGYGAATLSFLFALIYLLNRKRAESGFLTFMDTISFKLIAFSFIFFTLGLTTGSVWANVAWGSWWSWDPKETWSLITWLVYAFYLHLRLVKGKKGMVCAWINILGFFCILFTFLGVNYLLRGLHSYL